MPTAIPAKPTKYRGRQYRSILEAKWAAFFDLLKWPVEYEPFEMGGWIPDFIIAGKHPVLVEVKPELRLVDKAKVSNTRYPTLCLDGMPFAGHGPHTGQLFYDTYLDSADDEGAKQILFLSFTDSSCGHVDNGGPIIFAREGRTGRLDFLADVNTWNGGTSFIYDRSLGGELHADYETKTAFSAARDTWIEACNITQWKRPVAA